jgi:hypothetical protein
MWVVPGGLSARGHRLALPKRGIRRVLSVGVAVAEGNLAFRSANVITMNPEQPLADALAVRDGRIAAVGSWQDVAPPWTWGAGLYCLGSSTVTSTSPGPA